MSQGLIFAEAAYVEQPEAPAQAQFLWHGADGSLWDIGEPMGSAYLLAGVRGLGLPPRTRWATRSAALAGSRHRGGRDEEREVFWPLAIRKPGGGQAYLDLDSMFWDSLDYDTVGTWEVVDPEGRRRLLDLRLDEGNEVVIDQMPTLSGRQRYGIYLVANDPYWRAAQPVVRQFQVGASVQPFIPASGAPPFYISPASTATNAEVRNDGDVPTWMRWRVKAGPSGMQGVSFGVRLPDGTDAMIGLPDLTSGQEWVVDTEAQTAFRDGVRVRGALSPHEFAPVPARGATVLPINATGEGTITVEFTQRYRRAWGSR